MHSSARENIAPPHLSRLAHSPETSLGGEGLLDAKWRLGAAGSRDFWESARAPGGNDISARGAGKRALARQQPKVEFEVAAGAQSKADTLASLGILTVGHHSFERPERIRSGACGQCPLNSATCRCVEATRKGLHSCVTSSARCVLRSHATAVTHRTRLVLLRTAGSARWPGSAHSCALATPGLQWAH